MMLHCDHCRRSLGADTHRYWQMRFCSATCVAEYQGRLADGTRVKIGQLETIPARQPGCRSVVAADSIAVAAAA